MKQEPRQAMGWFIDEQFKMQTEIKENPDFLKVLVCKSRVIPIVRRSNGPSLKGKGRGCRCMRLCVRCRITKGLMS